MEDWEKHINYKDVLAGLFYKYNWQWFASLNLEKGGVLYAESLPPIFAERFDIRFLVATYEANRI